jgi:DNA topoisomerase I
VRPRRNKPIGAPELDADPRLSARAAGLRYVNDQGPGIVRRRRGKGFTYLGVDSRPIKGVRTLNRIRSLVIPPAWTDVWICPIENGHIQAVGRDSRGRKQYRYHPLYRQVRDEVKFDRMLAFGAILPKIRKAVDNDLSLPGLSERKVVAAIVRLLDETCIRVGNDEYAKENNSFGLTTLRDKHAEVHGNGVRLHFRGKSGQNHDITLRDERLAKIVKRLQQLPGQELFQYESDGGDYLKVDSADVNDYLREITMDDFTAKDFRTWHGTCHIAEYLQVLGPAESESESKRNIVEAVRQTAKRLGNRPAACRKYYIHPAVFDGYSEQTMFSVTPPQEKGVGSANQLRPQERLVLDIVQGYTDRAPAQSRAKLKRVG